MGSDKALLMLPDGRTALAATLAAARAVAERVLLLVDTDEHAARLLATLPGEPPPLVLDDTPGAGPLAALARALAAAERGTVLALPVDAPLVQPALLRVWLDLYAALRGPLAIVAEVGGVIQPLPALYDARLAAAARAALAGGRRDLRALIEAAGRRLRVLREDEVRAHDPELLSYARCNTPDDWRALLARVREQASRP